MLVIDECTSSAASPPPQYYENLRAPRRPSSRVPTPRIAGTPVLQASSPPLALTPNVPLQQPIPAHLPAPRALVPQRHSYFPGSATQSPQGPDEQDRRA